MPTKIATIKPAMRILGVRLKLIRLPIYQRLIKEKEPEKPENENDSAYTDAFQKLHDTGHDEACSRID